MNYVAENRRPHYCVIKDLGRLVADDVGDGKRRVFVCRRCLSTRPTLENLQMHEKVCSEEEHHVLVKMPSEKEKWLKFRNLQHRMRVSFLIVASFEYFTSPLYDRDEPVEGFECRERRLDVCAYSYQRISIDGSHPQEPVYYRGLDPSDTMEHFLEDMAREESEVFQILSTKVPITLCDEGARNLEASNENCYICRDPFIQGDVKVMDHSHVTGKIRGNAHNYCNLQLKEAKFLPVVLQNLSHYEGRLILQAIGKHGPKSVKVLPQTIDTFVSVTVNRCRYIDFSRFLKAPLNDLVDSLSTKSGSEHFHFIRQNFGEDNLSKIIHKQYMCRDYLSSAIQLSEPELPDASKFADRISGSVVSDAEYQHIKDVWTHFEMQTIEDYLRHFLLIQTLQFADIVENFRNSMMKDYLLDPMYYYSLPGYSYNCALFHTEVTLELIRDEDMYNTILSGLRGGITVVGSERLATANLPELPTFQPDNPISQILFLDYNSLYPSCMIEYPLPTAGFRYLDEYEMDRFNISEHDINSDKGYILVVDLEYPEELHDRDDQFPMAPENRTVTTDMLSDHTKMLADQCGIKLKDDRKLCQTLLPKERYVVHYLSLRYYMSKGMILTNIHQIIEFRQSTWLQDFIQFTCNLRKESDNEFDKNIHKSVACNVFGKTIENQKKRINVKLCTSSKQLMKLVRKPTFQAIRVFSDNCAAVQFYNEQVTLSRPVAVGFSILELSKLKMFQFYHDFLLKNFETSKVSVLSCDTDSWLVHFKDLPELGDVMWRNRKLFDLSSLPDDSLLKDDRNKHVPGKLKIQLGDSIITEAVVLSPKCYSILTTNGTKSALKGVTGSVKHDRYRDCLLKEESYSDHVLSIRHFNQQLYHVTTKRRMLSPVESKRFYFSARDSVSYGHYRIQQGT